MGEGFPNGEDICNILDACARNGVTRIKLEGFEAELVVSIPHIERIVEPQPTSAEEVRGNTIQAQQVVENQSLEEQELALKEEQIAEMLIVDPLRAEELMAMGELEPTGVLDGGVED